MRKIVNNEINGLQTAIIDTLFTDNMETALNQVFEQARTAILNGKKYSCAA